MQPPHSLGLDHTVPEPFPSLGLQRWMSSAAALLSCKLPSSLKCSALGLSSLAAMCVPQLLPQEACGYGAIPRHHQTSSNAQCIQPSLSPKHEQRPERSTQHHCATGWNQHLMCHQYSEATPVSRSKVQWTGSACGSLKLLGRAGWSGTAAQEGRKQTRGQTAFPVLFGGLLRALLHMTFHVGCKE